MQPFVRRFLPVFAATLLFAAGARAERIVQVNEIGIGPRVFDQPSVAANGSTIHVAFVGDSTGGNPQIPSTALFYAAVNGAADFTSKATTRSQVIVTPAVPIDNGPYTQARTHRSPCARRTAWSSCSRHCPATILRPDSSSSGP